MCRQRPHREGRGPYYSLLHVVPHCKGWCLPVFRPPAPGLRPVASRGAASPCRSRTAGSPPAAGPPPPCVGVLRASSCPSQEHHEGVRRLPRLNQLEVLLRGLVDDDV